MASAPSVPAKQDVLRFAIIEYLSSVVKQGTLNAEGTESLEVAVQCLSEAFGLSVEDEECSKRLSVKPLMLPVVFETGYNVLTGQGGAGKPGGQPGPSDEHDQPSTQPGTVQQEDFVSATISAVASNESDNSLLQKFIGTLEAKGFFAGLTKGTPEWNERVAKANAKFQERYGSKAPPSVPAPGEAPAVEDLRQRYDAETKKFEQAEALKAQGNSQLSAGRHAEAADLYSKAIEVWPSNAVYYSNRAAAYTHMLKYEEALRDCQQAIALKPDFSKAYSRLGTIHFQGGRYKQAIEEGYRKALELEPNNAQYKQALSMAEERLREQEEAARGAGPGMGEQDGDAPPELMGMMNDPEMIAMAETMMKDPSFMQMAQGMMSNPEMMGEMLKQMSAQADGEAGAAGAGSGGAAGGSAGAAAGGPRGA